MNIVEAMRAAIEAGINCIARPTVHGCCMAIKPLSDRQKVRMAIFSDRCSLAEIYNCWSPRPEDITADDWEVFDPARYALPDPEPQKLTWIDFPANDVNFKLHITDAADAEIYTAADQLADMLKNGFKVKTRFKAIDAEIKRREKSNI